MCCVVVWFSNWLTNRKVRLHVCTSLSASSPSSSPSGWHRHIHTVSRKSFEPQLLKSWNINSFESNHVSVARGLRSFIMHLTPPPPPHPAFKLWHRLEPECLPAAFLPLLGELKGAKRASQSEHKFSIISPSWWPPPSLFSNSGTSWFFFFHRLALIYPPSSFCWRLSKPRRIKIRSAEGACRPALFYLLF